MPRPAFLQDVTGRRGEKIVELCLTQYAAFTRPLFNPGFLGDKWPAIDFFVELQDVPNATPYFFAQVKATSVPMTPRASSLHISSTKADISRLLQIPGPTYVFGVREPTQRVFVKSVHAGSAPKAITRIPLVNELTPENLRRLYDEVRRHWESVGRKPLTSSFA